MRLFARMLLTLALLVWAPLAAAQTFPALTGRVVDAANLLDPAQEQALDARLAALDKQSGRQLVVATVPDLQGYDISDFGYRLGRAWGIGTKEKNDGALLIVAPNDRKLRIEVGYGLEGILTDAVSSQVIRNVITPRFKAGDFPGGITAGVDALGQILTLPPDEAAAYAKKAEAAVRDQGGDASGIMVLFWIIVILVFILPMVFGSRDGRRHRGGAGPVIIWGPGWGGGSGGSGWGGGGGGWGGGDGGGFSGGGGGFGGGGASGGW
jgi:uncharacterized protein